MAFQPYHDFPELRLSPVGFGNLFRRLFADSLYFLQPVGMVLYNIQGLLAEVAHQTFGIYRTDALNDTGSQEALYACHAGR